MTTPEDFFGPVIYKYTSNEAVEDGILVDLFQSPALRNTKINLATTNLLQSKGYITLPANNDPDDKGTLNIANLRDLLMICLKKMSKKKDYFYEIRVQAPDGSNFVVWAKENETGYYTIMLPEDD